MMMHRKSPSSDHIINFKEKYTVKKIVLKGETTLFYVYKHKSKKGNS